MRRVLLAMLTAGACGGALGAQESPYVSYRDREIKALLAEEVESYVAGAGMGFALAAELNGYPGPKHVLELADSLDLSARQRAAIAESRDRMLHRAITLGEEIVAHERTLDSLFAAGAIEPEALARLTREIGELRGGFRGVHLAAHLDMVALLSDEQVARYLDLRGYVTAERGGHRHED